MVPDPVEAQTSLQSPGHLKSQHSGCDPNVDSRQWKHYRQISHTSNRMIELDCGRFKLKAEFSTGLVSIMLDHASFLYFSKQVRMVRQTVWGQRSQAWGFHYHGMSNWLSFSPGLLTVFVRTHQVRWENGEVSASRLDSCSTHCCWTGMCCCLAVGIRKHFKHTGLREFHVYLEHSQLRHTDIRILPWQYSRRFKTTRAIHSH